MSIRSGQDIPDRIKNAPKLLIGSDIFLDAFIALYSSEINWLMIVNYGNFYNLDLETIEDLVFVLMRTNTDFLNHINKKPDE
jgi:hypothetical protein